jgi:diguanylate cyclase (GGDEF)-like protein
MMDIDHFKVFNDTYGHLAGDQALIKIAEAIKSVIRRPGDLAARYGGEEFVVLQINTTEEGAAVVAEKIRRGIEELRMEIGEIKSIITVSIGGASVVPTDEMAPEELIGKADRALYMAKEEGRNRVIVWNPKVE